MIDKHTDFFEITDNFAKTANVSSTQILKSALDFKPKVTIAIPTYKRAALLKEAIDSAINQITNESYDIIVVDNDPERGCKTEQLMLSYDNKKISYYKNSENIGMAGNWNRLFELAEGEYVVMLHDDDLLFNDFLNTVSQFWLIEKDNYDLIYFPFVIYNDLNGIGNQKRFPNKKYKKLTLKYYDFLFENIVGPPIGMIVKKSIFIDLGGFDIEFYPSLDYHFYIKSSFYYNSCKLWGNPISIYRIFDNESLKKETLFGFVEKDLILKKNILKKIQIKIISKLWNRYLVVFVHKYFLYIRNNYKNVQLSEKEINQKYAKYNFIDYFLFKILNLVRNVFLKFRTTRLEL